MSLTGGFRGLRQRQQPSLNFLSRWPPERRVWSEGSRRSASQAAVNMGDVNISITLVPL